jgi:orotidine-5'-phosphate decarboxylase
MNKLAPIVLAVDTNDLEVATAWVGATDGVISVVKLGLEFYTTFGNEGVKAIADSCNTDIFLDLKLHDIPHTVAGAARAVSTLRPKFLTVHAAGGSAMVQAAADAMPSHNRCNNPYFPIGERCCRYRF